MLNVRYGVFTVVSSASRALPLLPPIPGILRRRTARRPNRVTHNEARPMTGTSPSCRIVARAAADKARGEVAVAHFTTVGAMSSCPPIPRKYRCNALSDVMGKFRTHAQQHAGLIHPRRRIDIA
jgi:hypothetical protein